MPLATSSKEPLTTFMPLVTSSKESLANARNLPFHASSKSSPLEKSSRTGIISFFNMTTRIEIGKYIEENQQEGRKKFVVCDGSFETFAELGDTDGKYQTPHGEMSVAFTVDRFGHRLVTFDVREIKGLQSPSKRKVRAVNVSNEGVGMTMLAHGKILRVTTEAKFE